MKKIVRLTENDLIRIVKQVISEQSAKWDSNEISFLEKKGFTKTINKKIGSFEFNKKYPNDHILITKPYPNGPAWSISTLQGTWVLPADLNFEFIEDYPNVDYKSLKKYKKS